MSVNPTIAFIRSTALLTDAMIASYVAAQQIQVTRDFAPIWDIDATCVAVPSGGVIPASAWQLWFMDHSDQAGDLGYHDDQGNPIAYVFTADDLAAGVSWTVTASHETLEMLGDPTIDKVRDGGGLEYAYEACDACEDDSLGYMINGHMMSAFVTPAWFDPNGVAPFVYPPAVPITGPFQLAPGGYIGVRTLPDGEWSQRCAFKDFIDAAKGNAVPRQVKGPNSRTMRRFRA